MPPHECFHFVNSLNECLSFGGKKGPTPINGTYKTEIFMRMDLILSFYQMSFVRTFVCQINGMCGVNSTRSVIIIANFVKQFIIVS